MIVYDLKEQELIVFSEKQKDKVLASIYRNDTFREYAVTLYRGWNDDCNVGYVMKALNTILEPEEDLSSEDILKAHEDLDYGWSLRLGYNKYNLQVDYYTYYMPSGCM